MEPHEPPELLDAIAANPEDLGSWHVLADWLLEHDAPHAVLAVFELKLHTGTNDVDILGGLAEQRQARLKLDARGVPLKNALWRCGYVTRLDLEARSWRGDGPADWKRFFASPQLRALPWLRLLCNDWEETEDATLSWLPELWLPDALPAPLRRFGVRTRNVVDAGGLSRLEARPARAERLDLAIIPRDARVLLDVLAALARAWPLIDLGGTPLPDGQATALLERVPPARLVLGGTGVGGAEARELDRPTLRWAPPGVTAALVNLDHGDFVPLDATRPLFGELRSRLSLEAWGWCRDASTPLVDGEVLVGAEALGAQRWQVLLGGDLDARYREWLRGQ